MSVVPSLTFRAIALLSGAVAFPLGSTGFATAAPPEGNHGETTKLHASGAVGPDLESATSPPYTEGPMDDAAATDGGEKTNVSGEGPELGCLSRTLCAIKDKIRWQTAAWTPVQCKTIATAVLTSAKRHGISPSLLLAVMINESDLNEKAARITMHENKVYAKDSGLMALRCVLGKRDRCLNGNVRGLAWTALMDPATNIDLGANELAYWKNGGAVTRTIVKVRDAGGRVRPVYRTVPCRHKDHAYWAHYNHGPRYIDHGFARHYPHRVAVLDHALAAVLNLDTPELRGAPVTMHDPGKRQRTPDRPLEPRYRKLCTQIQSVGTCSAVALN